MEGWGPRSSTVNGDCFAEDGGIGAVVSLLLLIAALAFPRAFG
jgi:hypothetical protein